MRWILIWTLGASLACSGMSMNLEEMILSAVPKDMPVHPAEDAFNPSFNTSTVNGSRDVQLSWSEPAAEGRIKQIVTDLGEAGWSVELTNTGSELLQTGTLTATREEQTFTLSYEQADAEIRFETRWLDPS